MNKTYLSIISKVCAPLIALILCGCPSQKEDDSYQLDTPVAIEHQLAVTIDDLPATGGAGLTAKEISDLFLTGVERAPIPGAIGFALGKFMQLDDEKDIITEWSGAGVTIGNHTYSHPHFNNLSLQEYIQEASMTRDILAQLLGTPSTWYFRYTFLEEGNTQPKYDGFHQWLSQSNHISVPVTTDFHDYAYDTAYGRCLSLNDNKRIELLEDLYLQAAIDQLEYSAGLAQRLQLGKIPHILLMHVTPFSAKMFRRLILAYKAAGVEFVSVEQALQHQVYQQPVNFPSEFSLTLLERIAESQGSGTDNSDLSSMDTVLQTFCF